MNFSLSKLNIAFFVVLTFASAVGMSQDAQAAVAFNTFPISYTQATNRDYPMIDARNVSAGGSFSNSQSDHDNGVSASPGDEIEFQIYYHNTSIDTDEATNVIIRAILPGGSRTAHTVEAVIDSDQTSPVSSSAAFYGGNISINISGNSQTLEFVSGSVRHFPNRSASGQIPSGGDNLTGSGLSIGTVRGCFEFSGIATFRARVGSQQTVSDTRGLNLTKRVMNLTRGETTFRDSTAAGPGDRVKFEIRFDTSGNASQNNVIVRDILPSRLNYLSGTLQENGATVSGSYETDFFASGRNLGALSAGVSKTLTFEGTVSSASAFTGGSTLINTANVRSDQVSTRQDDADIVVQIQTTSSFSLRKTAFNLTKGVDATSVAADPGDIITYTLYYRNTGNTTITDAIIQDDIRDILELAQMTNTGSAVVDVGILKYQPVTVQAGVEVAKTFQVQIRPAADFPPISDLVMVNTYGNEVRIPVRRPQVLGIISPPRTGAGEWLTVSLASFVTLSYWLFKKRNKFGTLQANKFRVE